MPNHISSLKQQRRRRELNQQQRWPQWLRCRHRYLQNRPSPIKTVLKNHRRRTILPVNLRRRPQTKLQLSYLEHHGCHPAAGQQGQVEVQEGWDHRVTDVVVLAIGVKTGGGPSVESEAGEPASPRAPAVPIMATVAAGLNPKDMHRGT